MLLPDNLSAHALRELTTLDTGSGVALTRLAKRLDVRVSVLIREYTMLGDACLGAHIGPGWVRLQCDEGGRWTAHLTESGRQQGAALHDLQNGSTR